MLSNFTSNLSKQIALFVVELQEKSTEKAISFEIKESNTHIIISWKSAKHYQETFEIELWSESDSYTLRGEHIIDDLLKKGTETHFLYEERSEKELTDLVKEILQKTKNSVSELIGLP